MNNKINNKFTILNRLYWSWIYGVAFIGIIGFLFFTIITIRDSITAMNVFTKYNDYVEQNVEFLTKVDPNGNTLNELDKINFTINRLIQVKKEKQFISGCSSGAHILTQSTQFDFKKRCKNAFDNLTTIPETDLAEFGCGYAYGAITKKTQVNYIFSKKCTEFANKEDNYIKIFTFKLKLTSIGFKSYILSGDKTEFFIEDLWWDQSTSNISFLIMVSLWLVIPLFIILLTILLKKWFKYIIFN